MAQSVNVRVIDKLPSYKKSLYSVLDDALKSTARDILISAKTKAPKKVGHLRSDAVAEKVKPLHHRVSFNKEYARFQEFGGDSKRTVRKYTTSGTGKSYLKSSGDKATNKLRSDIKKHSLRARA